MHRLLVIERSATLRRAMQKLLGSHGYLIAEAPTFEAGLTQLREHASEYDAVLIGWPARTDPVADEMLALLESPDFKTLAVAVLSEDADPAKLNWTTRRPSTAMLLWGGYQELPESLGKLLTQSPAPSKLAANPAADASDVIRILFVDDSPTVRVSFRKLLTRRGYEVDTASSVREGLQLAKQNRYDIAIIDYFMPEATGDELCRQLRNNPETAGITSSIITGTYLDKVIQDSLNAGAVECMFKNEGEDLFLARVAAMSRSIHIKKSIEKERKRLEGILGSVGDGVYGVDNAGMITFMNPAARQILGYNAKEQPYIGKTPHSLFHYAFQDGTPNPVTTCFLSRAYESGDRLNNWQTVFWSSHRRPVPVECTVYPLHIEGRREGSVVAFRDVSERKLMEEELRWQANHDSLTKLLNRHYFENQLEQEVHRLQRNDEVSVLLYLDLDQFKYINDTAGHAAGDRLLVQVGHLLQTRLRASDTLARLGGDEFAVILRNVQGDLFAAADAFRNVLASKPFLYAGKMYKVTCSIGAARMDQYTVSPGEALSNADLACHIAKQKGRNQTHLFSPESDERKAMDLELGWSARLHEALEKDLFELVFHPIVGIRDLPPMSVDADPADRWRRIRERIGDKPMRYEVLLRMGGADGEIMPDAFLPTAERFNLMPQIDRWVIRHAIQALAEQNRRGNPVRFSINLSGHTIIDRNLASDIKALVEEFEVDPKHLLFEITETCAITNIDAARRLMDELHAMGCQFALDDFGSGFCSFGHLKHLPVDFIKIDGLFTQGVVSDPLDRAVVVSIVDIAHALGKRTVAEYVANAEILAQLQTCGVDYVQGHFIAYPLAELSSPVASAQVPVEAAIPQ